MSPPNTLPLLSQLTASTPECEDPIETYYLNPLEFENGTRIPVYSLEFFMGLNYGELRLEMSPNIVHVRSSIKKLLQEQKIALIPTEEALDAIIELQFHNLGSKIYDRKRYTDVLPHDEYEYRLRSFDLEHSLSIISSDGTRQHYRPPDQRLPHLRSTAHPFLVVSNAAATLFAAVLRRSPVEDIKVMVIQNKWYKAPLSFAQKPNWKELGHPLDKHSDPVEEILAHKKDESCPDLISDTSSLSSHTSLSTSMASQHLAWTQNPGTKRWVKKMKKIVERSIGYEEEVSNDKQTKSYRREKSRPYDEVMRTSRVSVRFAPYLRHERQIRAFDDISVPL
ncbi:hypothetical protein Moror_5482 [Moniliophthora roreri MCA 2997]|uniref:Uncharacterized protein n=1 Tax=Moniliophthora roreri (strain MCA 2997) TaxID=1381753 RepID=V2X389_MONRO|nr:hypothetical protein Moror_5482 [Moniliophthora roreri MCA 2997]